MFRWYVVNTYSGHENKVKANLEHRIESMGMEDRIFQVLVPMEDEIEIRQGQRHTVQKKVYPGYVLVEMILDPDSWFVVRNTPMAPLLKLSTHPTTLQTPGGGPAAWLLLPGLALVAVAAFAATRVSA